MHVALHTASSAVARSKKGNKGAHMQDCTEKKKTHTQKKIGPCAAASPLQQPPAESRLHTAVCFPAGGTKIKQKEAVELFLH